MSLAGRRLMLALLAALAAIGPMSTSLYLPSLPALREVFDASTGEVQSTLTIALIGFALSQLVYGPLADRFGRRVVLFGGFLIYIAANIACALAGSIEMLIVARFMQSVGCCAGAVVSRAVVRDQFPPAEIARVMATIGLALTLGPASAPFIGGQLHTHFGWRSNFLALAAAGLVLLALSWARLPESPRQGEYGRISAGRIAGDFVQLLRSRSFRLNSLIVGGVFGGLFGFMAGAPIVLIGQLGVSPDLYGLYTMLGPAGYVCGNLVMQHLLPRLGSPRLTGIGCAVNLAGSLLLLGLALSLQPSVAALMGPMFVFGVGMGLLLSNAMAGALMEHAAIAGTASALLGFMQMGIGAAGSALVTALPGESDAPLATVVAGMSLLAALCAFALRRR